MRSRAIIFGAVVGCCLLFGGGWVVLAALRSDSTTSSARVKVVRSGSAWVSERPEPRAATMRPAKRLLVTAVDPDDTRLNGRLTELPLEGGTRAASGRPLACQRVHMSGGRGLCLALAAPGVSYRVRIFDSRFRVRHDFSLDGVPSRARVSPSGRLGAFTLFVDGHSYTHDGGFSTSTAIVDMRRGEVLVNLEEFDAYRDGRRIDAPDFNYWGVTFADDDDRFYATLATGGKRFLVEGSLRRGQVRVLRENVECPSLSPDGTRIAYKKRVGGEADWRLHVLDLETMADTILSEPRSIDDQAEWLDRETVLYGDGRSVWAVRADGSGRPRALLRDATSPGAVR